MLYYHQTVNFSTINISLFEGDDNFLNISMSCWKGQTRWLCTDSLHVATTNVVAFPTFIPACNNKLEPGCITCFGVVAISIDKM